MDSPALAWSDSLQDLDWNELSALYRVAPLGDKKPQALETAFGNSMFRCLVRDEQGRLVGAGRAVADGVDCSYLCDVAVHPSQQGRGLGRQVLEYLEKKAREGGARRIVLQARDKAVDFYSRNGYSTEEKTFVLFDDIQHYRMKKDL